MTTKRTYPHETHIRTLRIRGVAVPVSNQRGGLMILAKPEEKGRHVTIEGWEGEVEYREKDAKGFSLQTIQGKKLCVAVFPRRVPGTYRIDAYGRSYEYVTINPGYVTTLDWT